MRLPKWAVLEFSGRVWTPAQARTSGWPGVEEQSQCSLYSPSGIQEEFKVPISRTLRALLGGGSCSRASGGLPSRNLVSHYRQWTRAWCSSLLTWDPVAWYLAR